MEFLSLIEEGQHIAIIDYLKNCECLSEKNEIRLIQRGNHVEIMTYIANHKFSEKAFDAFLFRGKLNEIRFYIAKHNVLKSGLLDLGEPVTDEYTGSLLRARANGLFSQDAAEEWIEAECLLVSSGYHCAIRRYISQVPLTQKAYDMLKTYGTSEDFLVYDLCWGKRVFEG